jgi:hypothetical protein
MHMRYEMSAVAKKYRTAPIPADEVRKWLENKSLEGWFVRSHEASPVDDAMELIDRYGHVPESAWSLKFKSRADVNALKRAMIEPYIDFLNSDEPNLKPSSRQGHHRGWRISSSSTVQIYV